MTRWRVGTRGSDLARRQTRWVCDRLTEQHPEVTIETVVIRTHGDEHPDQPIDEFWPVGGFVGAIERALLAGDVDFAVHSYKDMPVAPTLGLAVAAVPTREAAHDVLITRAPVDWRKLPQGFRIATSSARRTAQWRATADVVIVPIRGNVPTRVAKLDSEVLDAVVLAAAGLKRLGLRPEHRIDLPVEAFTPAPGQGALAVQTRDGDPIAEIVGSIDDPVVRRCVDAERAFLSAVGGGCETPAGALAVAEVGSIRLCGQLFPAEGCGGAARGVSGVETGCIPHDVGRRLAERLVRELQDVA
jgi:hydroxymethylbilane synthase